MIHSTSKTFIEIGSNCFDTLNFLGGEGWSGVIIEPVEYYLNKISPKYENIVYENFAVSDINEKKDFVYFDPEKLDSIEDYRESFASFDRSDLGKWVSGAGSLDESGISTAFDNFPEEFMIKKKVDCFTLDYVIEKHKLDRVDALKIDAEGQEWRILRLFSFRVRPFWIKFETDHFKKSEKGRRNLRYIYSKLMSLGYSIRKLKHDCICIHSSTYISSPTLSTDDAIKRYKKDFQHLKTLDELESVV